jgi:hypothetical protein
MSPNPVERNPVTRFLLGLAVIVGMMVGAQLLAGALLSVEFPYGALVGAVVGSLLVFGGFVVWYARYDAAADEE